MMREVAGQSRLSLRRLWAVLNLVLGISAEGLGFHFITEARAREQTADKGVPPVLSESEDGSA